MPRGGKRKGAGRPKGTGKFGEPTKAVRLPISMISQVMGFIDRKGLKYPLYSTRTKTGSPESAEVPAERFDLVNHLVPELEATLFVLMADDSMSGAGIYANDTLIVNTNREAQHNDIIVAEVNGVSTARRLIVKGKKMELKAENSKFAVTKIADDEELVIWGVVTNTIHNL